MRLALLSLSFLIIHPDQALALQTHGAPTGLYVHQMAHILYALALAYLFWDIRRSSFTSKGWKYFLCFCMLMLLWNIIAFIGHVAQVSVAEEAIDKSRGYIHSSLLAPFTFNKIIFYISKFDHLICVPALYFLYLAMRSFYHSSEGNNKREGR